MKYILVLIIILSTVSFTYAYTHSDGCGSVCFGTCEDYSNTPMPAAKCAGIDPVSQSICKVMFGDCARLENGKCGWKPNADYQACTNNPASYKQQYIQWQENFVRERIAAKAAVVLKLQLPQKKNMMNLSIALAFTNPSGKPSYQGARIVSEDIPFHNEKTIFGFRNGDGITHIKLPTHDVIIENETYSYVEAGMDRQENGMFRLSRVPSDSSGNTYHLNGVFYAQGYFFVINEIIRFNEEKIFYSKQ